ncbi:MAG TPA: UPF0182 family protein [Gemmatimonadales bacterium]|nr:UPF0182 family protein [Gemmatimonadales bacterium]
MARRRILLVLLLVVVLLFLAWPSLSTTLSNWWWFKEIGYEVVFARQFTTRLSLFMGVGTAVSLFLYANFRLALRGAAVLPYPVHLGPNLPAVNLTGVVRSLSLPAAIILGIFFGLAGGGAWDTVLLALHGVAFGTTDPAFGRDVSYYIFTLPLIDGTLTMLATMLVLTLIMLFPIYLARGSFVVTPPRHIHLDRRASIHAGVVLGALFVIIALQLWLVDAPSLVYSTTGPLVGASYTDLHATLPALYISALAALAAAGMIVAGGVRGHLTRSALQAIVGYVAVALVGRGVIPLIMQKVFVAPTELTRETPYLQDHIVATRRAWGLDSVDVKELGDAGSLSLTDIQNNGPTIDNVRLWDRDPLLQTFGQLQELRTFYDFVSIDDDRYWIDGKYRQVLLSPRELNAASLPTRTFINEHLTFTHGMGLTLGPVNQVTSDGLPVLFIKDLPPVSSVSLKVTRPQIYYGEIANDYVVVGTKQREFDHPAGEQDVYAAYDGTGGVRVGNALRRLILATRFSASNLLFSADIGDDSRVLYNRNVVARVKQALPFLRFDRDPYLVVTADGKLKWILDGYTTSDAYPYAEPVDDGTTYMRNSVKVIVDAYDGSITSYISTPNDPLIRTWSAIFPGIFHPLASLPADLRAHLRYPDDLYRTQAALYATYHMDSPVDFYHRADQWQIPSVGSSDASVPFMRHIIMRLPGEASAEYVYMVPFTPRGKDNLAAWMVARNDGAEYGRLRVYKFPEQSLVFGPTQVENLINQNTEISQQVSLWDQRGSKVIRGDLLVIPIEQALLYVQPLYLQAEGGRIPELKRVVVAYQNTVVMEETLDGALNDIFGASTRPRNPTSGTSSSAVAPAGGDTQSLITEAQQHYDNALQAQRNGDWAKYGDEIKTLGELLTRLRNAPGTKKP